MRRRSGTWATPRITTSWAATPASGRSSSVMWPRRGESNPEMVLRVVVSAGLWLRHAGGRLVEQQQRGLGCERAGDLEPPLVAVGQVARDLVGAGAQPHAIEQLGGALPQATLDLLEATAPGQDVAQAERDAGVHADQNVLDRGHVAEEPDVLERPADAERGDLIGTETDERAALPRHGAGVGGVEAGEDVEQRRLAGAVGADDRGDPTVEREIDAVDGGEAAEPLGHSARLEARHRSPTSPRRAGTMPR